MLPEIEEAEQKFREAENNLHRVISECHAKCPHPIEACREAQHTEYLRPFRVCTMCGYAEEGWGCGYWKLNFNYAQVPVISRDAAYSQLKKCWSQEELSEVRFKKTPAKAG